MIRKLFYSIYKRVPAGSRIWKIMSVLYVFMFDFRNRKNIKIIKRNCRFKDCHKGGRVFILGNGPSLNGVDFARLKDEYVFTCNLSMLNENFDQLRTNYHFVMDNIYLGARRQGETFDNQKQINVFDTMRSNSDCVFFFDAGDMNLVRENLGDMDAHYLGFSAKLNKISRIDIATLLPATNNVMHQMIMTAIYMGFSEIYLLGCDFSVLESVIKMKKGEKINGVHSYVDRAQEMEAIHTKMLCKETLRKRLSITLEAFSFFEILYDYCRNNSIVLENLSEDTIIDCIPRSHIDDVLRE